jgi:hypothetical protein
MFQQEPRLFSLAIILPLPLDHQEIISFVNIFVFHSVVRTMSDKVSRQSKIKEIKRRQRMRSGELNATRWRRIEASSKKTSDSFSLSWIQQSRAEKNARGLQNANWFLMVHGPCPGPHENDCITFVSERSRAGSPRQWPKTLMQPKLIEASFIHQPAELQMSLLICNGKKNRRLLA